MDGQPLDNMGEKDVMLVVFLFEWGRPIRIGDIKDHLKLPHSTLNSIVKRLQAKGLVEWIEYGPVTLTPQGAKLAAHHLKHHIVIHHYLVNFLGLEDSKAHEESMKVAGHLSCETVEKMKEANSRCQLEPCSIITDSTLTSNLANKLEAC